LQICAKEAIVRSGYKLEAHRCTEALKEEQHQLIYLFEIAGRAFAAKNFEQKTAHYHDTIRAIITQALKKKGGEGGNNNGLPSFYPSASITDIKETRQRGMEKERERREYVLI
jgi:hypothetical protein